MLKVVHVTWIDPCFAGSGWMTQSDFQDWIKTDTNESDSVGILAYESESFIVLIQSVGVKQIADGLKISRTAIKQIKELAQLPIDLEVSA